MRLHWLKWFSEAFVDFELKNQYHVPGAQLQSSLMAILVGTFAAVGGFLYGYDTGLSNNILSMNFVIRHFSDSGVGFSNSERAIATASLSLGTMFGSIISPLLSDTIGRKMAILFAALVVFNIGNICQVASTGSALLCVGRSITGTAVGVLSAVVPLYQSEASPKWVRGAIVSTYQWAVTWGFLCSSAISQGTHKMGNSGSYRIPIGLQSGWALALSVGMFFLPESPRFHVMKDRIPEAAHSLSMLRRVPEDDPGLIEELVDIKAAYDYTKALTPYSYLDCFRSGPGRSKQGLRMITGIVLQASQQATGINFIFYYGVWFFVSTGVVKQSYLYSLLTYAVNVVGTIPGILLIEIIGRRKSLLYGGIGMSVSNFVIAIVGTIQKSSTVTNKVMLAFVCVFIFFFALTWGPGVWVITSEIFPLGVRGRAVSLSAATNWLFNFAFAFVSPYLIGGDNDSTMSLGNKIFFLWGSLNLLATVFAYFCVYETKGLRLEEIDEMYETCKTARSSKKFVRKNGFDGANIEQLRHNIAHEVNEYSERFNNHEDGGLHRRHNTHQDTNDDNDDHTKSNTSNSDGNDGYKNETNTTSTAADPINHQENGDNKYIDLIQSTNMETRTDDYNNDFEKNGTPSSDGSTTIRSSGAAMQVPSNIHNTHVPLRLGESVAASDVVSQPSDPISNGTQNIQNYSSNGYSANPQHILNNNANTASNNNMDLYLDLGYGFQISNNMYQSGAPSVSSASSDSVSSMLNISIEGHDLREYVNNFQLRQRQHQMQQAASNERDIGDVSRDYRAGYFNSSYPSSEANTPNLAADNHGTLNHSNINNINDTININEHTGGQLTNVGNRFDNSSSTDMSSVPSETSSL